MPTYHGNDFLTATVLATKNELIQGSITNTVNDDDYFRFTVTEADNQIQLSSDSYIDNDGVNDNVLDTHVYLYDSTETQIDQNDDGVGNNFSLTMVNLPLGDYYVRVTSYSATASGDYQFRFVMIENGVYPPIDSMVAITPPTNTAFNIDYGGLHVNIDSLDTDQFIHPYHTTSVPFITASRVTNSDGLSLMPNRPTVKVLSCNRPMMFTGNSEIHKESNFRLAGTVKKEGVNYVGKTMRLYDRPSGELIGTTVSDSNGQWKFPTNLHENSLYYVIAFDDMDAPVLQAVIHDALVPVPV